MRISTAWLIAACLTASLPVYAQSNANTNTELNTKETTPRKAVRAQPLATLVQPIQRSAPARVVSLNHAKIAAQISGQVTAIKVQVGNRVNTGDTLASLDCSDYNRAMTESSARLDANYSRRKLAKQQLERTQRLAKSQTVSEDVLNQRQAEFDAAIADIAAQRTQLDRARTTASRCNVKAPFDGVVVSRSGQVGEYITPGAVVLTLVDTFNIELSAQIADQDASSLTQATQLRFHYANDTFDVIARSVLPVIDELTRSRETRLRFVGDLPSVGATGRLVWTLKDNALPSNLVVTHNDQLGLFIVNNDNATFVALPSAVEGRPALVDLPLESRVVTEGRRSLSDGDAIIVVE